MLDKLRYKLAPVLLLLTFKKGFTVHVILGKSVKGKEVQSQYSVYDTYLHPLHFCLSSRKNTLF